MKYKPLLIGMNNPVSTRPGHELYPLPEGCTGHRLWTMLHARTGATMRQYVDSFERRNLVHGREWDRLAARARAFEAVNELRDSGRTVVLLGQEVRAAFHYVMRDALNENDVLTGAPDGLPPVLIHPVEAGGCTWRQVPHPSGLNRWYNDVENVKLVELLMEELYVEYQKRVEHAGATS